MELVRLVGPCHTNFFNENLVILLSKNCFSIRITQTNRIYHIPRIIPRSAQFISHSIPNQWKHRFYSIFGIRMALMCVCVWFVFTLQLSFSAVRVHWKARAHSFRSTASAKAFVCIVQRTTKMHPHKLNILSLHAYTHSNQMDGILTRRKNYQK